MLPYRRFMRCTVAGAKFNIASDFSTFFKWGLDLYIWEKSSTFSPFWEKVVILFLNLIECKIQFIQEMYNLLIDLL